MEVEYIGDSCVEYEGEYGLKDVLGEEVVWIVLEKVDEGQECVFEDENCVNECPDGKDDVSDVVCGLGGWLLVGVCDFDGDFFDLDVVGWGGLLLVGGCDFFLLVVCFLCCHDGCGVDGCVAKLQNKLKWWCDIV